MFEFLEILNSVLKEIVLYIVLGIAGLIGEMIRRKYNSNSKKFDIFAKDNKERLDKMQTCLDSQNDRGIRHSKALVDLAEHQDIETQRLHGNDALTNPIKNRIERNLKDDDGNY